MSNQKTRQTTKISEINDRFNNLRYKISLYPQPNNDSNLSSDYIVDVYGYDFDLNKTFILSCLNTVYDNAEFDYRKYVEEYKCVVNSEEKTWQDIHVYEDVIGFRTICPKCCANCMFARPIPEYEELFESETRKKYHCMDPRIAKVFNDVTVDDSFLDDEGHVAIDSELAPVTYENGICNDYAKAVPLKYKKAGQSMRDFVFHTCMNKEGEHESMIRYEVQQQLNEQISNVRIREIIGNDGDANQNGIDDECESIIGNLGA